MIRTVCLNPTIDRAYFIDGYVPGKPYRNTEPKIDVSGKGINAGRVCKLLGEQVVGYGFIGEDNASKVLKALDNYGIISRFIQVPGETRTTVNIIDRSLSTESEIIEKGPFVGERECKELLCVLNEDIQQGDVVLCSGILAHGNPSDMYVEISRKCQSVGAVCILDTNGQNLKDSLNGHYLMMKPNARELAELCNKNQTDNLDDLIDMATTLLQTSDNILVSMGSSGGLLVSKQSVRAYHVPEIEAMSTIGCGDSTVAGFAVGYKRGYTLDEIVKLAFACGTANALTDSVGLIDCEKMNSIKEKIESYSIAKR